MRSALVDSRCTILQRRRTTTEQSLGTAHVSHKLVLECRALVQEAAEMGASVAAVGLGVAGKIDAARGTVVFSPNLPAMRNFPLARELETGLGLPVTIETTPMYSAWANPGRAPGGHSQLDRHHPGYGGGGCLILDGRLWQGDGLGFVGEIGHMIVWPGGSRCACGASGCLEAYASGRALVEGIRDAEARGELPEGDLHRLHTRGELTPEDVYRHALAGDALACSVFRTMGRALGLALTNLCTVLGLRNAVIGGGVSGSWDQFIEHLKESLAENARMFDPDEMVITRSLLGDDAALIGAAQTALGLEKV